MLWRKLHIVTSKTKQLVKLHLELTLFPFLIVQLASQHDFVPCDHIMVQRTYSLPPGLTDQVELIQGSLGKSGIVK